MFRVKNIPVWKDFIFRMVRSEGNLRGFNFFLGVGLINVMIFAKTTFYDPVYSVEAARLRKIDLEERDK